MASAKKQELAKTVKNEDLVFCKCGTMISGDNKCSFFHKDMNSACLSCANCCQINRNPPKKEDVKYAIDVCPDCCKLYSVTTPLSCIVTQKLLCKTHQLERNAVLKHYENHEIAHCPDCGNGLTYIEAWLYHSTKTIPAGHRVRCTCENDSDCDVCERCHRCCEFRKQRM
jgi:hypothetical protein